MKTIMHSSHSKVNYYLLIFFWNILQFWRHFMVENCYHYFAFVNDFCNFKLMMISTIVKTSARKLDELKLKLVSTWQCVSFFIDSKWRVKGQTGGVKEQGDRYLTHTRTHTRAHTHTQEMNCLMNEFGVGFAKYANYYDFLKCVFLFFFGGGLKFTFSANICYK